ncbi:MAG: RDD family protein [Halococcoides sp.]
MRLSIVGTWHVNRRSVTRASLDAVDGDAEALAVESPQIRDPRTWLRAVLAAPLVFLGLGLMGVLVQLPLMAAVGRDAISTECRIALADDRPVHFVDRHPMLVVLDRSMAWPVLNWLTVLGLVVRWPAATAAAAGLALAGSLLVGLRFRLGTRRMAALGALAVSATGWWALVALPGGLLVAATSMLLGTAIVFVTAHDRNHEMLDDCVALADDEGYESMVLLTGRAHVPGIVDVIDDYAVDLDVIYLQRVFRQGSTVDPDAVTDRSTTNLGVSVDDRLTEHVLQKRLLAGAIDTAIVTVVTLLTTGLSMAVVLGLVAIAPDELVLASAVGIALAIVGPWLAYYIVLERWHGQTLGHRIAGLEVIAVGGGRPTTKQIVLRTGGRLFDFLPVAYALGIGVALAGDGSRRFGDLRAGTAVVRADRSRR